MTNSNIINVVFISDNGYAMPTGVAINSLRLNRNINYTYNIYIMCNNVNQDNKTRFYALNDNNFVIVIIDINENRLFDNMSKSYSKVTNTSLYKFQIPDVLDKLDKVIYVDGDVIIQDDLIELFNTKIDSQYAAVVKDGPRKKSLNGGEKHRLSAEPTYFNSGMMLLNLGLLRKDNVPKKLINYRLEGYNYFMDQDAFNVVFYGKVLYLPLQYNLLLHILSPIWEMNSIEIISDYYSIPKVRNKEDYFNNAKIIHYTFDKPWKYYDIPQSEKWMHYYEKSPFYDNNLNRDTYLSHYHNSKSFKIGKMITFLPRIIKKWMKSLSEG